MKESDQNDRSSETKKTFHPFFKPNAGIKRDHASSSDAFPNNATDDQQKPAKIKLKKSSNLKSLWKPNSPSTSTPTVVTKPTLPPAPLHPFFNKRPASTTTTAKPLVNKEPERSTITQQEKRSIIEQPLPPLPPPLKRKRYNDYRNEPMWPDKTLFEGGHIGAPSRLGLQDNEEHNVAKKKSHMPSSSTVFLHFQQQQKDRTRHLKDIIQNESAHYFTPSSHPSCPERAKIKTKTHAMTIPQIQHLIENMYPSCKNSPACQYILDKMIKGRRRPCHHSSTKKIPWTERYRPNKVQALLGNQEDNIYLRDWLYQMKVAAPSTLDTLSSHHKKKKKTSINKSKQLLDAFLQDPLAYGAMVEDKEDDEFVPAGRKKSNRAVGRPANTHKNKRQPASTIAMQSNLILLVGDYGSGKTSAVYTAAEEAGYQVFEIHPGIKRSGKDLVSYVGEMTESHLVTSSSNAKKHKKEPILQEDHTTDTSQQFMRQFAATKITSESDVIDIDGEEDDHFQEAPIKEDDLMELDEEPKQSLVLLEEADMLYEEDKGFWSSVVDLAQKSKRPIVLTCNDRNLIPTEILFLQGTLEYRYPDIEELMAYLHLICFSEGYLVDPVDLAGLVAAIKKDVRRLINALELWCTEEKEASNQNRSTTDDDQDTVHLSPCTDLFHRYTAIRAYDDNHTRMTQLFHLQQSSKSGVDLVRFYDTCFIHHAKENSKNEDLLNTMKQLDRVSWGDILMNASTQHNYQLHECDEYGPSQDQLLGYTPLWKNPMDLDRSLCDSIGTCFWIQSYEQMKKDVAWQNAILPTVWDALVKERSIAMDDYLFAASNLIPLRAYYLSDTLTMSDYIPHIRGMCQEDQGVASRGRAIRTRRKRRYLPLTEEQRFVLSTEPPAYLDMTEDWCEKALAWSKQFIF